MCDLGEHDPNSSFGIMVSVQGCARGGKGAPVSDLGEQDPNSPIGVMVSVQRVCKVGGVQGEMSVQGVTSAPLGGERAAKSLFQVMVSVQGVCELGSKCATVAQGEHKCALGWPAAAPSRL